MFFRFYCVAVMSFAFGCTGCDYSGGVANTQRSSNFMKKLLNEQWSSCKSIFYCKKADLFFLKISNKAHICLPQIDAAIVLN